MRLSWVLFLAVVNGSVSWAGTSDYLGGGGWGSSGGELLKSLQNPWWVKNTVRVRYCVQIDEQGMSASPEKVRFLVQRAIQYWKSELVGNFDFIEFGQEGGKLSGELEKGFRFLGVGQQEFVFSECDGQEDLRFQFGFGTLTSEQKSKIEDIKKYVGLAVRTDYDSVLLKGKGFIYIASDRGPDQFTGGPSYIESPWRYDILLYAMLLHEMGHVFGIPHGGEMVSLMSVQMPDFWLSKFFEKGLNDFSIEWMPKFFAPDLRMAVCFSNWSRDAALKSFFGVPAESGILQLKVGRVPGELDVLAHVSSVGPPLVLGKIENVSYKVLAMSAAVSLHIEADQKVFPPEYTFLPFIVGPFSVTAQTQGARFVPQGSAKGKAMMLTLGPSSFHLYGLQDDEIKHLVNGFPGEGLRPENCLTHQSFFRR